MCVMSTSLKLCFNLRCLSQRITAERAKIYYPNITDEHLSHLNHYEQDHRGYRNQWTEEGYMEAAVEWVSIRLRNGWKLPWEKEEREGSSTVGVEEKSVGLIGGTHNAAPSGSKRSLPEASDNSSKKARRS